MSALPALDDFAHLTSKLVTCLSILLSQEDNIGTVNRRALIERVFVCVHATLKSDIHILLILISQQNPDILISNLLAVPIQTQEHGVSVEHGVSGILLHAGGVVHMGEALRQTDLRFIGVFCDFCEAEETHGRRSNDDFFF